MLEKLIMGIRWLKKVNNELIRNFTINTIAEKLIFSNTTQSTRSNNKHYSSCFLQPNHSLLAKALFVKKYIYYFVTITLTKH